MLGVQLRAERVDLRLQVLEVGGRRATQCGIGGLGRGDLRGVGVDGAGGRLANVVGGAFLKQRELLLGGVEAGLRRRNRFGSTADEQRVQFGLLSGKASLRAGHVFGTSLSLQRGQLGLLLRQPFLGGGDIVGLGTALDGRQLGLCRGQIGSRLQHLDLGRILLELGQDIASFDRRADIDQDTLHAARRLGQHGDLLAGADVTAVGHGLLDGSAFRFGRRNHLRLSRRGSIRARSERSTASGHEGGC